MFEQNIYLIGPMGVGKTLIGRQLAKKITRHFYDSDLEIVRQTGVDIDYIFDREGETGFRLRESKMLTKLCQLKNIVLATGGGAVLSPDNQKTLTNGFVIYLKPNINVVTKRLQDNHKGRPLLIGTDIKTTLSDIYKKRAPIYQKCANLIIDTNNKNTHEIIEEITQALNKP